PDKQDGDHHTRGKSNMADWIAAAAFALLDVLGDEIQRNAVAFEPAGAAADGGHQLGHLLGEPRGFLGRGLEGAKFLRVELRARYIQVLESFQSELGDD